MKVFALIKTQFQAIHQWSDCEIKEVAFLKHPHHHYFNVTVKIQQFHFNRDVEYIDMQLRLDKFISNHLLGINICEYRPDISDVISYMGSKSCEMLAEEILSFVANLFVTKEGLEKRDIMVGVYEDNRHGAEVFNYD